MFSSHLAVGKSVRLWAVLVPATQSELRFDTQRFSEIACRELRLDRGTSEPYLRRPALKMTMIMNGSWKTRLLGHPELLPVPQFYLAASSERKYGVAAASTGLQHFYSNGPIPLLYGSSQATRGNITLSGVPNCLQYCVIFIVCTPCRNVVGGRHNTSWRSASWRPMV